MKTFLKFINEDLEVDLCCIILTFLSAILIVQVFFRYVLGESLTWSEELARYLFVWLVYMGIPYGCRMMRHIKIDAGLMLFPQKTREYVVIFGDICFMLLALIVAFYSALLVSNQYQIGLVSPAMGLPMWVVYAAPLTGFSLTVIRQFQVILLRFSQLKANTNQESTESM